MDPTESLDVSGIHPMSKSTLGPCLVAFSGKKESVSEMFIHSEEEQVEALLNLTASRGHINPAMTPTSANHRTSGTSNIVLRYIVSDIWMDHNT
jgi:hypothetical protein